jgi:hypothetical protein
MSLPCRTPPGIAIATDGRQPVRGLRRDTAVQGGGAMRKLKLELEELSVETFHAEAGPGKDGQGTVHGHQETWPFRCTMFCTYNCTGIPCFNSARPGC